MGLEAFSMQAGPHLIHYPLKTGSAAEAIERTSGEGSEHFTLSPAISHALLVSDDQALKSPWETGIFYEIHVIQLRINKQSQAFTAAPSASIDVCSNKTVGYVLHCRVLDWNSRTLNSGFPKRKIGFYPRSGHLRFGVDKMGLGKVFSKYLSFPCQFQSTNGSVFINQPITDATQSTYLQSHKMPKERN